MRWNRKTQLRSLYHPVHLSSAGGVARMATPQRGPGGLPVQLSDMTSPALQMDSFLHDSFATRVVQRAQA
jgi:hypothetical protein